MSRRILVQRPIDWPLGRDRTIVRKEALWRDYGKRIDYDLALGRLGEQCGKIPRGPGASARILGMVLTHDERRGSFADPGAAFYFELDGRGRSGDPRSD